MKRLQEIGTDCFSRVAQWTQRSAIIVGHFGDLLMSIKVMRHASGKLCSMKCSLMELLMMNIHPPILCTASGRDDDVTRRRYGY